jgi:hypothetical protein
MSGERNMPLPLLSPAQAATLLDQVIYEQVLECIDLDALYRLEQSLTLMVGEIDGVPDDRICDTATAMLDRALLRLPDDVRRYLQAADWSGGDCALCEAEAEEPAARRAPAGGSGQRRAMRLKS